MKSTFSMALVVALSLSGMHSAIHAVTKAEISIAIGAAMSSIYGTYRTVCDDTLATSAMKTVEKYYVGLPTKFIKYVSKHGFRPLYISCFDFNSVVRNNDTVSPSLCIRAFNDCFQRHEKIALVGTALAGSVAVGMSLLGLCGIAMNSARYWYRTVVGKNDVDGAQEVHDGLCSGLQRLGIGIATGVVAIGSAVLLVEEMDMHS